MRSPENVADRKALSEWHTVWRKLPQAVSFFSTPGVKGRFHAEKENQSPPYPQFSLTIPETIRFERGFGKRLQRIVSAQASGKEEKEHASCGWVENDYRDWRRSLAPRPKRTSTGQWVGVGRFKANGRFRSYEAYQKG
jgi:hypothetical protein